MRLMNYFVAMVLVLLLVACGGSGGDSTPTSTTPSFTVGGSVSGLAGTLVLQNNGGDDLSLTSNGTFTFAIGLADGASYDVTVLSQPAGQQCSISNGMGVVAAANVSDVSISCLGASMNLGFVNYGVSTTSPSIVTSAFRVVDKNSGVPVQDLVVSDFQVLEDGVEVTALESFKDLEPVANIPYVYYTVLALDVSSSLSLADIDQVKTTAKAIIADSVTGVSNLKPNQRVAIYTFDGTVSQIANFTSDVNVLFSAIDGISRGGPSTNLYGSIVSGMGRWSDTFSLSGITYGAMIVVTDGDDTAAVYTEQDAINAVGNKDLYAIPVGSAVNLATLENIAGADHVFPAADFTQLGTVFDQVAAELNAFSDGLYFLYYASPKRSGSHTIEVSIIGNSNVGADASVSGTFSAAGFTNVTPEVIITGDEYILLDSPVNWNVETKWSNDPLNYFSSVSDAAVLSVLDLVGNGTSATLSLAGNQEGQATVTVTDQNWGVSATKTAFVVSNKPVVTASTGVEFGSIKLSWQAMQGATSYRVYWNNVGGVTSADSLLIDTAQTSVVHKNIDPAQTYFYVVVPTVTAYPVLPSVEVSAQPFARMLSMSGNHTCYLDAVTGVFCQGRNNKGQSMVPVLVNPRQVSAGREHTCALDDTGVVCWGDDTFGQSTVPPLSNPRAVAAGSRCTCVLDDSGAVCWGQDATGIVNTVPVLSNPTEITMDAGGAHVCALDDSGAVCWGSELYFITSEPALSNARALVAGVSHACALDDSGVVCWGANESGQSTVPVLSNPSALMAGLAHTCAMDDTGLVCWGGKDYTASNGTLVTRDYGQTVVPALSNPVAFAGGENDTCAIEDSGIVCWGMDNYGELSTINGPVAEVAVGQYHNCVLDSAGVRCFGVDSSGQLSVPALSNPVAVTAGNAHTCAADASGVVCWGDNSMGQTSAVPAVSFPQALAAGDSHTCVLNQDPASLNPGEVLCWGNNAFGQDMSIVPALTNPVSIDAGSYSSCALDNVSDPATGIDTNKVLCWGDALVVNTLPVLNNATALSVGDNHACAIDSGNVTCWGSITHGQTTVPVLSNPTAVAAGAGHSCALDDTGVVCWGDDTYGQSTVPGLSNPASVVAGDFTTCAEDDTGIVCWGMFNMLLRIQ